MLAMNLWLFTIFLIASRAVCISELKGKKIPKLLKLEEQ